MSELAAAVTGANAAAAGNKGPGRLIEQHFFDEDWTRVVEASGGPLAVVGVRQQGVITTGHDDDGGGVEATRAAAAAVVPEEEEGDGGLRLTFRHAAIATACMNLAVVANDGTTKAGQRRELLGCAKRGWEAVQLRDPTMPESWLALARLWHHFHSDLLTSSVVNGDEKDGGRGKGEWKRTVSRLLKKAVSLDPSLPFAQELSVKGPIPG